MALPPKPTESDLRQLIENQISESQTIDYKLSLSVNTDEEKKEFLADIVSFANTIGGHLIIGMKEDKGLPIELPGVQIDDPDQTKLRLEEVIQKGVAQRISGIAIRPPIKLANDNWAIVIYIPQSLAAPHMVSYKGSSRFYARHSGGKYQLDIPQIRQAFLLSASIEQKIRDFRLDRIAKVRADDMPVTLNNYPKIVLHSIPLAAYQVTQVFEISDMPRAFFTHTSDYRFQHHRFNLDGAVFYTQTGESAVMRAYQQIFRNGNFEYVSADIITPSINDRELIGIPSPEFEVQLIQQTDKILSFQKTIGIEPPIYLLVSFVGVKGLKIARGLQLIYQGIDRDILLIPEILFDTYPSKIEEVARLLRPALDTIWNSAGAPQSPNYDKDGNYRRRE